MAVTIATSPGRKNTVVVVAIGLDGMAEAPVVKTLTEPVGRSAKKVWGSSQAFHVSATTR